MKKTKFVFVSTLLCFVVMGCAGMLTVKQREQIVSDIGIAVEARVIPKVADKITRLLEEKLAGVDISEEAKAEITLEAVRLARDAVTEAAAAAANAIVPEASTSDEDKNWWKKIVGGLLVTGLQFAAGAQSGKG